MTIRKLAPTLTLFSSLLLASGMAIGQTGMQDDPQGMDRQQGMEQQQQQQGGMDQQRQGGMDQQQQGGMQEQPGMGAGAPQHDFDDQSLEQFADAYIDITEIQEDYTQRLEGTEDPDQARDLQQQANDEMVEAIENRGLSVPEYSEIATALDTDPELRDELAAMIQERR
ncbi:DUF4168 domain-containing protein [Alkalilimnicola ehrlichii MLHE-1]|uniref:DUF4168 domain-containing protein n=1 Tax=Alkalilimnicola ehrlichii (strain ATCC BAA-1101 / DSM 17681 / MLHE-1) TaxID=187272 RepID=Q0A8W3_ALKEH|nr:DUF4168 domain-containing protein [Alkalilimnicola ehrlichii]ABI56724.1 hypothetical protein Mlg_1375 [Alkalilimnicola ehrlichii MLHE-1]